VTTESTIVKRVLTERELADQDVITLMTHAYDLYMNGDPVGARFEASLAAEAVPRSGLAQAELGRRLMSLDEHDGAEAAFCRARDLGVRDAPIFHEMGRALLGQGRWGEAMRALSQAILLDPALGAAWADMGRAVRDGGQAEAAVRFLTRAVRLRPNHGPTRRALGCVQWEARAWAAASATLRIACALDPGDAQVWNALGSVLLERGCPFEAQRALVRASRLDPANPELLSHCLQARVFLNGQTTAQLARVYRVWQTRFGRPVPPPPVVTGLGRAPLRIAVLWGQADDHPMSLALRSLVRHRDPRRLRVIVLDDRVGGGEAATATPAMPGSVRAETRRLADAWIDVAALTNAAIVAQLRDHAPDVLVDLSGHGPGNRLSLFARLRPAPIQACWAWGGGTTGLGAMDLLIGDAVRLPPEEDSLCVERVVRLPKGAVTFEPSPDLMALAVDGRRPPREISGGIALGVGAPPMLVGDGCLDLWTAALRSLPTAELLVLASNWQDVEGLDHLRAGLRSRGVNPARVRILRTESDIERRQGLRRLDVFLDSWPCSCDLPVLEAMAVGIPVVTLPGSSPAGRIAASHLIHAGRTAGIAETRDDFAPCVQRALYAAREPVRWDARAWADGFTNALTNAALDVVRERQAVEDAPV